MNSEYNRLVALGVDRSNEFSDRHDNFDIILDEFDMTMNHMMKKIALYTYLEYPRIQDLYDPLALNY